MGAASFQALCDEFCDAAGVGREHLRQDAAGAMTFSSEIDEVVVNVVHTQASHPDHAFLLIDFGPPPDDTDAEAQALRTLLLINFTFLGHDTATAFSIHPVYGNVTLQASYPFRERSGEQLLHSIQLLVASARDWRETHFVQDGQAQADWAGFGRGLRA